ncbi:MAG TPA: alpha/beta hydrolase, partial [Hyphomicrobiales bacterium]|nr:alpha/beta hydrolase [Hyphomicrobiales bacterium]
TGLGERRHLFSGNVNLSTHIQDVAGVIESENLDDFALIGHSYGGMVITGVADRFASKISHIVYLDAFLPENGTSAFDFIGREGMLRNIEGAADNGGIGVPATPRDPSRVPEEFRHLMGTRGLHPLPTLVENLKLSGDHAKIAKRLYVLCTGDLPTIFVKAYEKTKADPAWKTETLPCGHMLQLEMLDRTAELLTGFIGK